jgi:hypothetical protein
MANTLGAKAGGELNVLFIVITVSACYETNLVRTLRMVDCVHVAMFEFTLLSTLIILARINPVIKGTPPEVLLGVSHWCMPRVTFKDLFAVGLRNAMIAGALDICWRVVIGVLLITLCLSAFTLCSSHCSSCNTGQGGGGVRIFSMWD